MGKHSNGEAHVTVSLLNTEEKSLALEVHVCVQDHVLGRVLTVRSGSHANWPQGFEPSAVTRPRKQQDAPQKQQAPAMLFTVLAAG